MRWIYRILAVLLIVAVSLVALLFLLPADRIAALAAARVEAATGRAITLTDVRPSLFPQLGVSTGRVEFANAGWSDAGPMLSAESVSVGVELMPLLSGDIRITGITIDTPEILLERSADGRANWQIGDGPGAAVTGSSGSGPDRGALGFTLDRAEIRGGRVTYADRATGRTITLTDVALDTALPGGDAPVDLTASASLGGQALTAEIGIAHLAALLAGDASAIDAALALGKASAGLRGELMTAPAPVFSGILDLDLPDTGAVLAALGQPRPDIPRGLGRAISASGSFGWADMTASLTGASIALDQNRLTGDADILLGGERPFVSATLSAGALDLSALRDEKGSGPGGAPASAREGWSRDPIDASALSAIDGELRLRAQSVNLGAPTFGVTAIDAVLRDGRLAADIRELAAYGGAVTGRITATGRSGITVAADIAARGIALQTFFADTLGFDRLTGSGDLTMKLTGAGHSLDEIMHSLDGTGSLRFGRGEILGVDLASMLRNVSGSFEKATGRTIFDEITATFEVENGVLNNVDLNLAAPLFDAAGSGTVGIGERVLDYRITPRILRDAAGEGGISVPLLITGSWSAPKFRPDLKALTDAKVKAETKKVEDAAKAKIDQKLGTTEGQTTEDAVKQKIEKELGKGLKGLFGKK